LYPFLPVKAWGCFPPADPIDRTNSEAGSVQQRVKGKKEF